MKVETVSNCLMVLIVFAIIGACTGSMALIGIERTLPPAVAPHQRLNDRSHSSINSAFA